MKDLAFLDVSDGVAPFFPEDVLFSAEASSSAATDFLRFVFMELFLDSSIMAGTTI